MERKQIEDMISKYGIGENQEGKIYVRNPGNDFETIKAAKNDITAYFAAIKAEKEERQRRIDAIEGLKELRDVRAEWSDYKYKFNRAIDSGSGRIPEKPQTNPEEIAERYPRAAAYLKADSYSNASNYEKAGAGKKALERIINGENHETVIAEMETEWKGAAHNAVMNS